MMIRFRPKDANELLEEEEEGVLRSLLNGEGNQRTRLFIKCSWAMMTMMTMKMKGKGD